jgi:hypothetical protein
MKKLILVIALVALLVFAGCKAATTDEKAEDKAFAKAEPDVTEAASGLVAETDTVEIGEMI